MIARAYYLLVCAVVGAVALALEVLAARAMAPALGSGSVSWCAILAVALGSLSLGNLLGGRLSERIAAEVVLAWSLAIAAASLVVLSQCYGGLVRWAAEQPLLVGECLAAGALQSVPLVLFGMAEPVVLQSARHDRGPWSGYVLAAGSTGGILGALVAGIVLLPSLGLARALLSAALLLALAAIPAALAARRWAAIALIVVTLLSAAWCFTRASEERAIESLYGRLEVRQTGTARTLWIDGLPQTGFPNQLKPGDALRGGYLLELALSMRPDMRMALVVGLGGGLAPRVLEMRGVECESVELDQAVIDVASREFGFRGAITQGDGRRFLSRCDRRYDLIFLDVCTADRLPWHLFTLEALQLVHRRLAPGGILAIQFIGDDGPWSASVLRTIEHVFGKNHSFSAASRFDAQRVRPRWLFAGDCPDFRVAVGDALSRGGLDSRPNWTTIRPSCPGSLLTDDHFAAELAWAETARQWRFARSGR